MKKLKTKVIENVISSILDSSLKDSKFDSKEMKLALKTMMNDGPEDFHFKFFYPIDGLMRTKVAKFMNKGAWDKEVSSVLFLFENYTFVEQNLLKFITTKEGSVCSADKSRWLVNALVKHFINGSPLDMVIGDKCYWKPHFWTSDQWIELFENLKHFYYGDSLPYMNFMRVNWIPLLKSK